MEATIDFPRGGIGIDRHGQDNENSITTKQQKQKDVTKKRRHMTDETKASGMTSSSSSRAILQIANLQLITMAGLLKIRMLIITLGML